MRKTVLILTIVAAIAFAAFTFPVGASGGSGPGTVVLGSLEDKYEPVRFDHAMHTAYFAKSCGDCHHEHGGYESQPCKGCHDLGADDFKGTVVQSFMSCKSCHGEFNPSVPGMPGLKVAYHKQCFGCHRGMGNVGKSPSGCTEQCHAGKKQI
jgi:hypothetical protein